MSTIECVLLKKTYPENNSSSARHAKCTEKAKRCLGKIVVALVIFWSKQIHFLSQTAKILLIMLYLFVRDKIILGCVTFPGYLTLASLGNFTQTDVGYSADWEKFYVNLHHNVLLQFTN